VLAVLELEQPQGREGRGEQKKLEAIALTFVGTIDETVEPWLLPDPEDDEDDSSEEAEQENKGASIPIGTIEESLDDATDPRASQQPIFVGILERNWVVLDVFNACLPDVSIGMGVFWQGVGAGEVDSACRLLHVPHEEWPRVTYGVQLMARTIADVRNEREAQRNKK
jgi:hypothetical protein